MTEYLAKIHQNAVESRQQLENDLNEYLDFQRLHNFDGTAHFRNIIFERVSFKSINLSGVTFFNCEFNRCDFRDATVAPLVKFVNSKIDDLTVINGDDLEYFYMDDYALQADSLTEFSPRKSLAMFLADFSKTKTARVALNAIASEAARSAYSYAATQSFFSAEPSTESNEKIATPQPSQETMFKMEP